MLIITAREVFLVSDMSLMVKEAAKPNTTNSQYRHSIFQTISARELHLLIYHIAHATLPLSLVN